MGIHYPSATNPGIGSDLVTTVSVAVAATNLVGVVAARATGFIINNSNKNLWVTFTGAAATAANPSIKVPASGGNVDIPDNYTGSISGIWESGATGNCIVHEFSYV